MITNSGYGGIQQALAYGVMLIAAGKTEDKAENGARIAWSGVGIDLKTDSPTPTSLPLRLVDYSGHRQLLVGGRFAYRLSLPRGCERLGGFVLE